MSGSCALAQSARPGEGQQSNSPAEGQSATEDELKAIATELSAIREQQAEAEKSKAAYEAEQRDQVYWPPIWSNWVLAVFAAFAAIIAAHSLGAIKEQASASLIAAKAAKKASRIAEQSLRLLNQPWLDTSDWTVTEMRGEGIPDSMGGRSRGKLLGFTVKFSVVNASRTPATIYHIEMRDSGSGSPPTEYVVTEVVQNLITPGSAYPYQAVIDDLSQSQIASYETGNGFIIDIGGTIHFGDLFSTKDPDNGEFVDGPRKRHFGRRCHLMRDNRTEFHRITGAERVEPELGHDKGQEDQG